MIISKHKNWKSIDMYDGNKKEYTDNELMELKIDIWSKLYKQLHEIRFMIVLCIMLLALCIAMFLFVLSI